MTKSERTKHKQLVDELKSWRARGETNIIIHGNSIITNSKTKNQSPSNTDPTTTSCDLNGIFFLTNMMHTT